MRVLELCLSPGHGGLELYVARLCALLMRRGHDCLAAVAPGTRLAGLLADQGVPCTEFRVRLRALPITAARNLARLIERERIDVVHINWAKDLPLAALAKRLSRRPVRLVHSRHMSITRGKRDPYHRLVYGSLDRLIVLSELMREEARRFLPMPEERIETIYPGVAAPPSGATDGAPRESESPLEVGLIGRIEPPKGQHLLIEAVDTLRERGIAVRARIIGHAMDETYLASLREDVARRGLEASIEFAGFHPDPLRIMSALDVIVLATRRETFGLVLAEAMRCGVAVIGSNAGGVPEIIEDGVSGLLFESCSAADLAEKLGLLAVDPVRRRELARAGKRRADRLFSEEKHADKLETALLAES